MDYIDYELDKYYKQIEISDEMNELGIDDYLDYFNYIDEQRAYEQEALF